MTEETRTNIGRMICFAEPFNFQRACASHLLPWQPDDESAGIKCVARGPWKRNQPSGMPSNIWALDCCRIPFSLSPAQLFHLQIAQNAWKSFEKSTSITAESRLKWHVYETAV